MSASGIRVLSWLRNPYFKSHIPNGSKSEKVSDVPQWYLGALVTQKLVHSLANFQWFKVSYSQGCPLVVSRCFGGPEVRTLNRKFPTVRSLIQSAMSPSGILVFG